MIKQYINVARISCFILFETEATGIRVQERVAKTRKSQEKSE